MSDLAAPNRKQAEQTQHVYVTVRGGVAYAAQVPDGIELHILDFDNLNSDYEATLASYSEDERSFINNIAQ